MKIFGLLDLLYGDKMVSKCCKSEVIVEHGDSESMYYVCEACKRPSDVFNKSGIPLDGLNKKLNGDV